MKRSHSKWVIATTLVVFALAQKATSQTTELNYQGSLQNGGTAAVGTFDFEFLLFDAASGGTQLGSTISRNGVVVANGQFAAKLDFGSQFPGANRFLEIHVRQTGGGAFTPLTPRQSVSTTPYAVKSLVADTATTATNATQLGGMSAGSFIQNGISQQSGSNFNISGDGSAGGTLSGNVVNAGTQFNLGGGRVISTNGSNNLFAGIGAGSANTTGNANAFFGQNSGLNNNSGSFNTFIGAAAGKANTSGGSNTFVGTGAGSNNISGFSNSFVGDSAGQFTTTGGNNTFFGTLTGGLNQTGNENTFVGSQAGYAASAGSLNTFVGFRAGNKSGASGNAFFGWKSGENTTTGNFSAFFGGNSGNANTTGAGNSFFGNGSGALNVSGGSNSFFGANTGNANQTGSSNSAFGFSADFLGSNLVNATAIGANAQVSQSNSLVLGSIMGINAALADTKVGIGTTAPTQKLDVRGNGFFEGALVANSGVTGRTSSASAGVYGTSFNSSGSGVVGYVSASIGATNGVWGISDSTSGTGVYGSATAATGATYGVYGTSNSTLGVGVNGYNPNGFAGYFNSGSGVGIYTHSTSGYAIQARSENTHALYADGSIFVNRWIVLQELPGSGSVNVCRSASNILSMCSSSLRYKQNIDRFSSGLSLINRLRPITFDWKADGKHDLGLAAEEVAKIEPLLVTYNKSGEVEGVKYDRIGVVLINAVKEQQAQIESLEKQNAVLQRQIEMQNAANKRREAEIDALKAIVCRSNRRAAVCRAKN